MAEGGGEFVFVGIPYSMKGKNMLSNEKMEALFNISVLGRVFHIPVNQKLCLLRYIFEIFLEYSIFQKSEYHYVKLFCGIFHFVKSHIPLNSVEYSKNNRTLFYGGVNFNEGKYWKKTNTDSSSLKN